MDAFDRFISALWRPVFCAIYWMTGITKARLAVAWYWAGSVMIDIQVLWRNKQDWVKEGVGWFVFGTLMLALVLFVQIYIWWPGVKASLNSSKGDSDVVALDPLAFIRPFLAFLFFVFLPLDRNEAIPNIILDDGGHLLFIGAMYAAIGPPGGKRSAVRRAIGWARATARSITAPTPTPAPALGRK